MTLAVNCNFKTSSIDDKAFFCQLSLTMIDDICFLTKFWAAKTTLTTIVSEEYFLYLDYIFPLNDIVVKQYIENAVKIKSLLILKVFYAFMFIFFRDRRLICCLCCLRYTGHFDHVNILSYKVSVIFKYQQKKSLQQKSLRFVGEHIYKLIHKRELTAIN